MKAYKLALPILAATVLLTGVAGVAVAQETGPFTVECREATKELDKAVKADEDWAKAKDQNQAYREAREEVAKDLRNNDIRPALRDQNARDVTAAEVQAVIDGLKSDPATDRARRIKLHEELLEDVRAMERKFDRAADDNEVRLERLAKDTDADKLRDEANKACGVETTTPTATPAPAPPVFVDLDCADFPRPDGTTAQQMLDSTPGADPHGIDANGNRVACDGTIDDNPAENGSSVDSVVTPSGGVATGGGPA